jgi:hypothetical protein
VPRSLSKALLQEIVRIWTTERVVKNCHLHPRLAFEFLVELFQDLPHGSQVELHEPGDLDDLLTYPIQILEDYGQGLITGVST